MVLGIVLAGVMALAPNMAAGAAGGGLERDVLRALNAFRADPALYSVGLSRYRGWFRATLVTFPRDPVRLVTHEGVVPVDEAILSLRGRDPLPRVDDDRVLGLGARDHVVDQRRSGATGHIDRDGSDPGDRASRWGGGSQVAEVIAYGARSGDDVIRQLIVDDGVPDRGHRRLLLDGSLRFAGVACGPHPIFRTMCVIDLAAAPGGRPTGIRTASIDPTIRIAFRPEH